MQKHTFELNPKIGPIVRKAILINSIHAEQFSAMVLAALLRLDYNLILQKAKFKCLFLSQERI